MLAQTPGNYFHKQISLKIMTCSENFFLSLNISSTVMCPIIARWWPSRVALDGEVGGDRGGDGDGDCLVGGGCGGGCGLGGGGCDGGGGGGGVNRLNFCLEQP